MPATQLFKMRTDAREIFGAGIEAVEAKAAVKRHCKMENTRLAVDETVYDLGAFRNIYVIGAGKAGASMAKAFEDMMGERITGGLVNVKYDHVADLRQVQLTEAGHPVQRAKTMGLNPGDFLSNNDAYHFFERLGDLVKTGPTNTNVMDLRIMLVV
jgi:glycerate-2-kinase